MASSNKSGVVPTISYEKDLTNQALNMAIQLNDSIAKFADEFAELDTAKDPIYLNIEVGNSALSATLNTKHSGYKQLKHTVGDGVDAFCQEIVDATKDLAQNLLTEEESIIKRIRLVDDFVRPLLEALRAGDNFEYIEPKEISASMHESEGHGSLVKIQGVTYNLTKTTMRYDPSEVDFNIFKPGKGDEPKRLSLKVHMDNPSDPGVARLYVELREENVYGNMLELAKYGEKFEQALDKLGKRVVQLMDELERNDAFSGKPGTTLEPII